MLVLILIANVAGVYMSEITFKILQNVGKLIIFIRGKQKAIPSYSFQNCHLPGFTAPHSIFNCVFISGHLFAHMSLCV